MKTKTCLDCGASVAYESGRPPSRCEPCRDARRREYLNEYNNDKRGRQRRIKDEDPLGPVDDEVRAMYPTFFELMGSNPYRQRKKVRCLKCATMFHTTRGDRTCSDCRTKLNATRYGLMAEIC